MNNDDGREMAFLIAGFGLGTMVGTVLGMLLAPKPGKELRADLMEYSKDYLDKVKDASRDAYEQSRERAREAYEKGRDRASKYSARLGDQISEIKEHIEESAEKLGERLHTDKGDKPAEPGS